MSAQYCVGNLQLYPTYMGQVEYNAHWSIF